MLKLLKITLTAFIAIQTVYASHRLSSLVIIHYGLVVHFTTMLLVALLAVYLKETRRTTVKWIRNLLVVYLATTLGVVLGVLLDVQHVFYKSTLYLLIVAIGLWVKVLTELVR